MKVVLLFLDGVGIGKPDPEINPLFQANLPTFQSFLGDKLFSTRQKKLFTSDVQLVPTNATLGVAGLPQSGTGQTAIFTGENAPKLIKKHFGPYPPSELRAMIYEKNIFRQLSVRDKEVAFANAFPKQFFEYTESGTRRLTVTTLSCIMANVTLLTADLLKNNQAVSADLHRERWPEMGYPDITPISSHEAGKHLADIAMKNDFTLFEYWLTDHAGHSRDMKKSVEVLERFDSFLGGLLEHIDLKETLVVMISDHGNIEDLSTKTHTRNPVPCIALGNKKKQFVAGVKNLTHITPGILTLFD